MKNKLELILFYEIKDIISQTGNAKKKKAHCILKTLYVYNVLKYIELCLKSIKIQKTIQ